MFDRPPLPPDRDRGRRYLRARLETDGKPLYTQWETEDIEADVWAALEKEFGPAVDPMTPADMVMAAGFPWLPSDDETAHNYAKERVLARQQRAADKRRAAERERQIAERIEADRAWREAEKRASEERIEAAIERAKRQRQHQGQTWESLFVEQSPGNPSDYLADWTNHRIADAVRERFGFPIQPEDVPRKMSYALDRFFPLTVIYWCLFPNAAPYEHRHFYLAEGETWIRRAIDNLKGKP